MQLFLGDEPPVGCYVGDNAQGALFAQDPAQTLAHLAPQCCYLQEKSGFGINQLFTSDTFRPLSDFGSAYFWRNLALVHPVLMLRQSFSNFYVQFAFRRPAALATAISEDRGQLLSRLPRGEDWC